MVQTSDVNVCTGPPRTIMLELRQCNDNARFPDEHTLGFAPAQGFVRPALNARRFPGDGGRNSEIKSDQDDRNIIITAGV